jgi:hypothetical protein
MNIKNTTSTSTGTNAKLNIINNNINEVDIQKNSILVNSIDNTINIFYDKIISGVDNITKNEENSISGSLSVNSIDSTIKIYEAGVGIITLGENKNNLVNYSIGTTNINDNNNNFSGLGNKENTPGEVNSENNIKLLESVDSYPRN